MTDTPDVEEEVLRALDDIAHTAALGQKGYMVLKAKWLIEDLSQQLQELRDEYGTVTGRMLRAEHERDALSQQLQACCDLVIAESLSTGHADDHLDLMREVLWQYRELRDQTGLSVNASEHLIAERDALKEICSNLEDQRDRAMAGAKALREQLEAVRQMLESAESHAWEETIAEALRLATPTGEQ